MTNRLRWLARRLDDGASPASTTVGPFAHPKGHIITDHAADALKERVFDLGLPIRRPGLPVMAPYFDMAFGWGVGCVLWLAPGLGETMCVLLGAGAALAWDLPVRMLRAVGVSQVTSVPVLMAMAVAVPLLLLPRGQGVPPPGGKPDWPLFLIQVANAGFFVHNALTAGLAENGRPLIPSELKALVVGVAARRWLLTVCRVVCLGRRWARRRRRRSAEGAALNQSRTMIPAFTAPWGTRPVGLGMTGRRAG